MVASVFTIMLGVLALVMFSYPVFWAYSGSEKEVLNEGYKKLGGYDILNFASGDNIYYLLGKIFLILAMVFAGLMILLALVDLIGRAAGNPQPKVEVRLIACGFFFFMLCAGVTLAIYCFKTSNEAVSSLGYGFLTAFGAAFLSLFFAPSRRKGIRKPKTKKASLNKFEN